MTSNGNYEHEANGHEVSKTIITANSNLCDIILKDLSNPDFVREKIVEYELLNSRKFEEKDQVISQLKQNLVELTEKRFRALTNNGQNNTSIDKNSLNGNLQFVLTEKDSKILELTDRIEEFQKEINNLKAVIKNQDDVILNHNNNIHELKTNNETVMRAKQESFRMMTEDLAKKQRLIDDQDFVIKSLKEKIESLEESYSQTRSNLEAKINEKNIDLQTKIASFEANLYEGRQYFEEMLNEKDKIIKEKTAELSRLLKANTNDEVSSPETGLEEDTTKNETTSAVITKYDDENLKNMKALYEHQIELFKVKIQMLEKTCLNYKQGIKEMNKSFGYQQQADEMSSIQMFKDLMQDLQKTNAQLETEKIELQVKSSNLKENLENVRVEKENLNKKLVVSDQLSQRLQNERLDFEASYKSQLVQKQDEIQNLNTNLYHLRIDFDALNIENQQLRQIATDYEQLKSTHDELSQHYETLYQQASDIVSGNQILNNQVATNAQQISQLEEIVEEYQLKVDHLVNCNSELNMQKINLDMKLAEVEAKCERYEYDLKDLEGLKDAKDEVEKLMKRFKELESELEEKNELIEQLNQAKEYLVENNSKLLTNNIKIQLFVESMGLNLEHMEANASVKEYEFLRNQFKEAQAEISELKFKNKEIEMNSSLLSDKIAKKEREVKELYSKLSDLQGELNIFRERLESQFEKSTQTEKEATEIDQLKATSLQNSDEFIAQLQFNFNEVQTENENLTEEINELKTKLIDLSRVENDYKEIKACLRETEEKLSNTEFTNAKLKAKLKQYIKQKKQMDETEDKTGKTDSTKIETESIKSSFGRTSVKSLEFSEKDYRDLQASFEKSKSEIAKLEEKLKINAETSNQSERMFLEGTRYASSEIYECVMNQARIIGDNNWTFALNQELKLSDLKQDYEILKEKYEKLLEMTSSNVQFDNVIIERVDTGYVNEKKDLIDEIEKLKKDLMASKNEATKEMNEKCNELFELNKLVASLRQKRSFDKEDELSKNKQEISQLDNGVQRTGSRQETLKEELNICQQNLDETRAQIQVLRISEASLKNELAELHKTFSIRIESSNYKLNNLVDNLRQEKCSIEEAFQQQLNEERIKNNLLDEEFRQANSQLEILASELGMCQMKLSDAVVKAEVLSLNEVSLKNELTRLTEQLKNEAQNKNYEILELNKLVETLKTEKLDIEVANKKIEELASSENNLKLDLEVYQKKFEESSPKLLSGSGKGKKSSKKSKINNDSKMSPELHDSGKLEKKLEEANRELAKLNEALIVSDKDLSEANLRIEALTTSEAFLKCELARLNERLTSESESLNDHVEKLNVLVSSENCLREELKSAEGRWTESLSRIEVLVLSEKSLKEELDLLNKKHESLKDKVHAVKSKKSKKPAQDAVEHQQEVAAADAGKKLQEELDSVKQQYAAITEQLGRYETNFSEILEQKDSLQSEIDDLKYNLSNFEKVKAEFMELKNIREALENELDDLRSKLTSFEEVQKECIDLRKAKTEVEELNLKYKTKLKQLLKQKQLQQQLKSNLSSSGSLTPCTIQIPDETSSSLLVNGTPLSFSPNLKTSPDTVAAECQTELDWEQIEKSSSELQEMSKRILEEKTEYETRIKELNDRLEHDRQQAQKSSVDSSESKIETLQQQNQKLKAKLKQLIEKNKNTGPEAETSEETSEPLKVLIEKQLEEIGKLKSNMNELQVVSQQEIAGLKLELQRMSRKSPQSSCGSPVCLESLVEQKQKTIDGLTGVLNLTSAQLENEKFNNEILVQSLKAEIYNKTLQIGELRVHIDHINRVSYASMDDGFSKVEQTNLNSEVDGKEISQTQSSQEENDRLRTEVEEKSAEIERLAYEFNDSQSRLVNGMIRITELESLIDLNQAEAEKLRDELALKTTQVNELSVKVVEITRCESSLNLEINNLREELEVKASQILELSEKISVKSCVETNFESEVARLGEELKLKTIQVSELSEKVVEIGSVEASLHAEIARLNEELKLKTSQCLELSEKIVDMTKFESGLREEFELKQIEIDDLKNELNAIRGDENNMMTQIEKKFQEKLQIKDEQISQLNEDLVQSQRRFDESKLGYEVNLNSIEQKYLDQLAALNEQHETNSANSDLEFENQISLKRDEIEGLRNELCVLKGIVEDKESEILELKGKYEQYIFDLNKQNEDNNRFTLDSYNAELQSKENSCNVMLTQIGELENLIMHKQKMADDLNGQLNELKQFIDTQRGQYENQLNFYMANVKEKEAKLSSMSNELNDLRLVNSQEIRRSLSPGDLTKADVTREKSGNGLEEKLRHCHLKCEMVVDTLSQLKRRNESLNNRIKSYREGLNGQIV